MWSDVIIRDHNNIRIRRNDKEETRKRGNEIDFQRPEGAGTLVHKQIPAMGMERGK